MRTPWIGFDKFSTGGAAVGCLMIILPLLPFLTVSVQASEDAAPEPGKVADVCQEFGDAMRDTARARDAGVPIEAALAANDDELRDMVAALYEPPLVSPDDAARIARDMCYLFPLGAFYSHRCNTHRDKQACAALRRLEPACGGYDPSSDEGDDVPDGEACMALVEHGEKALRRDISWTWTIGHEPPRGTRANGRPN
jgi:hypothetical protein